MEPTQRRTIGDNVYHLAKVFEHGTEAVRLARNLKKRNHVILSRTSHGGWAVYYRSRLQIKEISLESMH